MAAPRCAPESSARFRAQTGSGAGCIDDEFLRAGVHFEPAQKGGRVSGWQRMRRLLAGAGKPDRPGL